MFKLFGKNFYTEKDIAVLTGKTDLQVDVKYDRAYLQDQIDNGTKIIKQQAREIEQLTEQLDALRQQQIMLSTTTPTNKRKPRVTGAKP